MEIKFNKWKTIRENAGNEMEHQLHSFGEVVKDLLRRARGLRNRIPYRQEEMAVIPPNLIPQFTSFREDFTRLQRTIDNILLITTFPNYINELSLKEWWKKTADDLEKLLNIVFRSAILYIGDDGRVSQYNGEINSLPRQVNDKINQLHFKIETATTNDYTSIIRKAPHDRDSYGVASDMLEEENGDPYVLSILKAIANNQNPYLLTLRGTQDFSSPFLFQYNDAYVYSTKVLKKWQKKIGVDQVHEINLEILKNQPLQFPSISGDLKFRSLNLYPNVPNRQEFISLMKDICISINSGDKTYFEEFARQYRQGTKNKLELYYPDDEWERNYQTQRQLEPLVRLEKQL